MKQIPICTSDLHNALLDATTLKHTDLPKVLKFDVRLPVDDVLYQRIESDAFLAEQIFAGVGEAYKWAIAELAARAMDIDREVGAAMKTREKGIADLQEQALHVLESAKARMLAHSRNAIGNWRSDPENRQPSVTGGQEPDLADRPMSAEGSVNGPDVSRQLNRLLDQQAQLDKIIEQEIANSLSTGRATSPELCKLTEESRKLEHSIRDLLDDLA